MMNAIKILILSDSATLIEYHQNYLPRLLWLYIIKIQFCQTQLLRLIPSKFNLSDSAALIECHPNLSDSADLINCNQNSVFSDFQTDCFNLITLRINFTNLECYGWTPSKLDCCFDWMPSKLCFIRFDCFERLQESALSDSFASIEYRQTSNLLNKCFDLTASTFSFRWLSCCNWTLRRVSSIRANCPDECD